jgi:hypothetical protein
MSLMLRDLTAFKVSIADSEIQMVNVNALMDQKLDSPMLAVPVNQAVLTRQSAELMMPMVER